MSRREFKRTVKVEIIRRATRGNGILSNVYCENCGQMAFRFEIDHRDPDAMQIDKSRPLTASDGWLLCIPCHDEKTAKDVADIARAKRREAAHLGARRDKQKIASDPHALKSRHRPTHEGRPPANGQSHLARMGFVSVGDIASDVLAKLNPKKAAE